MAKESKREEYELYEDQEKLRPQGPPRTRKSGLSEMLPVRLPPSLMNSLRRRAQSEERSVSWVVRRAIERHLGASEDVGWLLPEAVLDAHYRPIREGAEAVRVLGDALRMLMAEAMEPAGGGKAAQEIAQEESLAGEWSRRPVQEIVRDARVKLACSIEHLDAIRRLSSPPVAFFSAALVARSVIEGSARSWWLLDPVIDARTRVARGMTERLYGLRRKRTVARSLALAPSDERTAALDEVEADIRSIEASAEQHGFEVKRDGKGRPTAIEQGRPDTTRLVNEIFAPYSTGAVDSMTDRLWAVIGHATGWEVELFSEAEQGPREGFETVSLAARPGSLSILMHATCIAAMDATDRLILYMRGSRTDHWADVRRAALSKLSTL